MVDPLQLAQHNANQARFLSLESSAVSTLALLNEQRIILATIVEQTKDIPRIKEDIKDTNERVDRLESKADQVSGMKTLLVFLIGGLGAAADHFFTRLWK